MRFKRRNWIVYPVDEPDIVSKGGWRAADAYLGSKRVFRTFKAASRYTRKAYRKHKHKFWVCTVKTKKELGKKVHCKTWYGWEE